MNHIGLHVGPACIANLFNIALYPTTSAMSELHPLPPSNTNETDFSFNIPSNSTFKCLLPIPAQNDSTTTRSSIDPCATFLFIFYSVLVGLVCAGGLCGAVVSFAVLRASQRGSHGVATFLLRVLSLSDAIFLSLWLVHYSFRFLLRYFDLPMTSAWLILRVASFPMMYMAQSFTIWIVVLIAINRYLAVCMPYRAVHFARLENFRRMVAGVVVFSVAANLPRYGEIAIGRDGQGQLVWNRTALYLNR